jgi:pimeloyl-ACP methyl ester carboxylesterase
MITDQHVTAQVVSQDGTVIAFERTGSGLPLILVEAAGHYRAFSSFTGLVGLLAERFTVFRYDRRGRGESTDTVPYAVQREVEDLAVLIEQAGGSAFLYGFSSGALLALQAAATGLAIPRLALLEPPIEAEEDRAAQQDFTAGLVEVLATGDRTAAVDYYLTAIGVPEEIIAGMRGTSSWTALEAAAPTLVYDCLISEATSFEVLSRITVPTLVLHSEGSSDDLQDMATTVAKAMPNATHRSLAGEWHGVSDETLAPVLAEFFLRSGR